MSPVENIPPSLTRKPAREHNRLREIERTRIDTASASVATSGFPGFSYPGTPSAGVASPRWYANIGVSFTVARISADTAGGGNLSVDVYHNGSFVLTLTLGTGANTALFTAVFSLAPGDYLGVVCTAVSGQENVSVDFYP